MQLRQGGAAHPEAGSVSPVDSRRRQAPARQAPPTLPHPGTPHPRARRGAAASVRRLQPSLLLLPPSSASFSASVERTPRPSFAELLQSREGRTSFSAYWLPKPPLARDEGTGTPVAVHLLIGRRRIGALIARLLPKATRRDPALYVPNFGFPSFTAPPPPAFSLVDCAGRSPFVS